MIAHKTILHFMHFASAIFIIVTLVQSIYLIYSMNQQAEGDLEKIVGQEENFCTYEAICDTKVKRLKIEEDDFAKREKDYCGFSLVKFLTDYTQEIPPHYFYNLTHNSYLFVVSLGAFLNNYNLFKIGVI